MFYFSPPCFRLIRQKLEFIYHVSTASDTPNVNPKAIQNKQLQNYELSCKLNRVSLFRERNSVALNTSSRRVEYGLNKLGSLR